MFGKLFLLSLLYLAQARPDDRRYEPSDLCPSQGHWLLPHEYDCTLFYYCEYGLKWIEPRMCAPGSEFSAELQVCIHPVLANCTLPGPPTEGPATEETIAPTAGSTTTIVVPTTYAPTTSAPTTLEVVTTTSAPITTASPNITTEAPVTTALPNITTEAPVTTVLPNITTEAPVTTALPNITTEAPVTTALPNITTEAPVTTALPNITTEAPVSTALPNITTEAPVTTALPNITTEAPVTTALPNITTEAPVSTALPNITTESPVTTALPNITTETPVTTALPNTTTEAPVTTALPNITTEAPVTTALPNITTEAPVTTALPNITTEAPVTTALPNITTEAPVTTALPNITTEAPVTTALPNITTEAPVTTALPNITTEAPVTTALPNITTEAPVTTALPNITTEAPVTTALPNITTTEAPTTTAAPTTQAPVTTSAPTTTTEAVPTSSTEQAPVELLPNGCPADFHVHQLLPHESDCTKFYYCIFGELVERSCGEGTAFNPTLQVCDHPDNVGCAVSNPGGSGENNEDSSEEDSVEWLENGCPADSTNVNQLLPHEDCGKFYQCVHGNKIELLCPAGLHFSVSENRCEYPAIAGCESGNGGGESGGNGGNSGEDNGNGGEDGGNGENGGEDGGEDGGNGAGEVETLPNGCPANYTIEQLLPSADCSKYYQCVHGNKVERPCAEGLHFSVAQNQCDYPQYAGCESGNGNGEDNGSGDGDGDIDVGTLPNGCPVDYTIEQLLPSADCSKYYQCVHGNKVERPCAEGLHFSVAQNQCDYPEFAGCESGSGDGNGEVGGNGGDDGDNGSGEIETLPNGCPADFTVEQLLPSADCGKFYQCVHGNKVERPCPSGLHFSVEKQECDYPTFAGCESGNGEDGNGGSGEDNGNGGEDGENGGNSDENGGSSGENGENSGEDGRDDRCQKACNIPPWSHRDCDKYWRCDGVNAALVTCSEGLHFNVDTLTCDLISNANCVQSLRRSNGPFIQIFNARLR
ncbi:uncharacterized protein LOC128681377 isoform X2 [Plodia interpunctella]|uniref:uncharacterized protein LOC128681377 isoform X2 n=1 Tax=Plodia interpunctella TaxID=58824 RepID=UPI002368D675|nr:uncharacterized protein LOC128681377 isoform X2 [Plodia interpunctella]